MKKIAMYIILAALCVQFAFAAGGFGLSPSIIQQEDLVRGETYEDSLRILSSEEVDKQVILEVTGDAADWIVFRDPDTDEILSGEITIPADGIREIYVDFNVPADLANGRYEGQFSVQSVVDEDSTVSQVSLVVITSYVLDVTGTERKDGEVASIVVLDTESGQDARIRYDFRNTGNVGFAPMGTALIKKDGLLLEKVEQEGTHVSPGENSIQVIEWSTEGRGTGDFAADVTIMSGETLVTEQTVAFSIEPRGTFTAEIIASEPEMPEEVIVDKPTKGKVRFHNTGKIELLASLQFEVYQDDELIDVIEGKEKLVPPSQSTELEFFFEADEPGEYVLKGLLLYSGYEDEFEDLTVTVKEQADEETINKEDFDEPTGGNTELIIVGTVIIGLLVIVILYLAFRRK